MQRDARKVAKQINIMQRDAIVVVGCVVRVARDILRLAALVNGGKRIPRGNDMANPRNLFCQTLASCCKDVP